MNAKTTGGLPARRRMCWIALLFAGVSPLSAHDASEITAKARLQADRIEVEFTMAYATAERLVVPDRLPASFPVKKFPEIKPALEARAPALAALVAGGRAFPPRGVEVALTRDDEVRIQLAFSPVGGPVRLDALLMQVLAADTYHCLLTIYGPRKNEIRYEALRLGKRTCELLTPGG